MPSIQGPPVTASEATDAEVAAAVAAAIATHEADTTNVHGIVDTAVLASDAELAAHEADTTSVHGIPNTAAIGAANLAAVPACRVFHSIDQSISDSTLTALAFDSDRSDPSGMHDPVENNSRITFATAGFYVAGVGMEWASAALGVRQLRIRLNGATNLGIIHKEAISGSAVGESLVVGYAFAATDYIEVIVYQTSTGALNVSTGGNWSPEFWATRLSA